MKRGQSGISCLLAVDKPYGLTSHDVVNRVRRVTKERRVGHTGTLDPAATGLLLLAVGPATRLSPYLMGHEKRYRGRICFGFSTNTDDAQGTVLYTASVPDEILDPVFAEGYVQTLCGTHEQMPPAFSAIKTDGQCAYVAARAGEAVQLQSRTITVHESFLIGLGETDEGLPYWDIEVRVSKGTYIRALARDIGESLGTQAHLASLIRCAVGEMHLKDASSLEAIEKAALHESSELSWLTQYVVDPVQALGLPTVTIKRDDISSLEQGKTLAAAPLTLDGLYAVICEKSLRAIHECRSGVLIPRTVIIGGVLGVKEKN